MFNIAIVFVAIFVAFVLSVIIDSHRIQKNLG